MHTHTHSMIHILWYTYKKETPTTPESLWNTNTYTHTHTQPHQHTYTHVYPFLLNQMQKLFDTFHHVIHISQRLVIKSLEPVYNIIQFLLKFY